MCTYARIHTHTNRKATYVHWEQWSSKSESACKLTKCHGERRNHRLATCLSMTPRDEILLNNRGICLCLPTLECLWQDFNDSTSTAFWQASLAMDETHNSKSTVNRSLTSQDQTLHLNIFLGSGEGISEQLFRTWHGHREERLHPDRAPLCTVYSANSWVRVAWVLLGPHASFSFLVELIQALWFSRVLAVCSRYLKHKAEIIPSCG